MTAATGYVETFDMRRRNTMSLTYWTAGDTRNRGREMLVFATAYRDAGVEPPRKDAPDHLPVVLELPATVNRVIGRRVLPSRWSDDDHAWLEIQKAQWQRKEIAITFRRCAERNGWRRPALPRKPLGCNRLP
jgi:nitrate reductase molybdenum cofactor assembly chaperone